MLVKLAGKKSKLATKQTKTSITDHGKSGKKTYVCYNSLKLRPNLMKFDNSKIWNYEIYLKSSGKTKESIF
jgi:hypothetical protein